MAAGLVLLYLLVCVSSLTPSVSTAAQRHQYGGKVAYITVLNNRSSKLELNVRVLGQSLRDTGTTIERIVLCTPDIPEERRELLKSEGWTVKMLEQHGYSDRSYDILQIWTMEEYHRLVYISPSAFVLRNIDHLFKCGNFCAVYQRSNHFNLALFVVKPSFHEYTKIIKWHRDRILSLSITVEDLLNSYYNIHYRLMYGIMFNEKWKTQQKDQLRLSAGYQASVFIYTVNSHWYMKEKLIYVIDYDVSYLHPACWWSHPLIEINMKWYNVRERLSSHWSEPSLLNPTTWLPFVLIVSILVAFYHLPFIHNMATSPYLKTVINIISLEQNGWLVGMLPITIALLSYLMAFQIVPLTMWPLQAWILFILWSATFMCVFYSLPCYLLFVATNNYLTSVFMETLVALIMFLFLHVTSLWLLYSIANFHIRLGITLVCGFVCLIYNHFVGKRVLRVWKREKLP